MTLARSSHFLLPTIMIGAFAACGPDAAAGDRTLLYKIAPSDLEVTVRERGEVQAARDTRVTSQLEGRATLIYLVKEGTVVKQGDLLAKLDCSAIEEKRATQAIAVAKAEAVFDQTRKNFEIVEKELLSAERTADSRLKIAEMKLEKFIGQPRSAASSAANGGNGAGPATDDGTNAEMLRRLHELFAEDTKGAAQDAAALADIDEKVIGLLGGTQNLAREMGEMATEVLKQIDEIGLARADLKLAEDTLSHTRRLASKAFVTRNELERDEINYKRQVSRMSVAWNSLQVLVKYTQQETRIGLVQEAENARLALESVRATNEARRVREAAELKSSESELRLATERLDNCNKQIQNAVMTAPSAGLVVYGRLDWDEPVFEGMEIRERQEIIILPDVSTMVVEIKVGEAQIDKVALEQPATVKIDAFAERAFTGKVVRVSTLPDPTKNPEVKVYRVAVQIQADNSDGALRPGMNATVEINIGRQHDVLSVPLAAVKRRADKYYVFKATPQGPVAQKVKLGGNNLTHVEIKKGLAVGDEVWLVQPEGAQLPPEKDKSQEAGTGKTDKTDQPAKDGAAKDGAPVEVANEPPAGEAAVADPNAKDAAPRDGNATEPAPPDKPKKDKKKKDKPPSTEAPAASGGQC